MRVSPSRGCTGAACVESSRRQRGAPAALAAVALAAVAAAQAAPAELALTSPAPEREVIAKKPAIRIAVEVPYDSASVQVILDGVDVTGLLAFEEGGLGFEPVDVLPGGEHVLSVRLRTAEGLDLSQTFEFRTRHTRALRQFASSLQLGLEAERLLDRHASPAPDPGYRGEGHALYGLHLAGERWNSRLDTDLWFLNQKLPVFPPRKEGLDLASFLLRTGYRGERHAFHADLGDVSVQGTTHSLATLARRGARLGFEIADVSLGGFAVSSRQLFGFTGGTGIGTDPDTNIYGFTTGFGLLEDRLNVNLIHARGGEPGSSFGLFTAQGGTRGRVTGVVLTARPWSSLQVEAEYDESDFDADTSDGLGAREDRAYGLRLAGQEGLFNYQVAWERLGPDYSVIASPVLSDRESAAVSGGVATARHSLNVTGMHQRNNLDLDPARPRLANREAALDYGLVLSEHWSLGAGWRDSRVESSHEPQGFLPQEIRTVGLTGRVQYRRGSWLAGIDLAHSDQDDAIVAGNGSEILTRTFSGGLQTERFSILPSISLTTTTFGETGVKSEQRIVSLMLNGRAAERRIGYGLALSYNDQQSSDGAFDGDTMNGEVRLSYRLLRKAANAPLADVSLRATRLEMSDRIAGIETRDWTVWLTVTFSPRFTF